MKDTKYKILAYFDNQSYRKLFNEVNSDYAENLQILLHNLSLFSYDVLIIGVILYKENISNIISAIRKITQIPRTMQNKRIRQRRKTDPGMQDKIFFCEVNKKIHCHRLVSRGTSLGCSLASEYRHYRYVPNRRSVTV